MDRFISYQRGRRSEWKGHESEKNVKNVISAARRSYWKTETQVFELVPCATGHAYTEVPESDWDARFFA
jgi:hypothetical protein